MCNRREGMELIIYILLFIGLATVLLIMEMMNRSAKIRSKYNDFQKDAEDGLENNFESNHRYAFIGTKGISVKRSKNGKFSLKSQSKLYGISLTQ